MTELRVSISPGGRLLDSGDESFTFFIRYEDAAGSSEIVSDWIMAVTRSAKHMTQSSEEPLIQFMNQVS